MYCGKLGEIFARFLLGMKLDVSFYVLSSLILPLCFFVVVVNRGYICTVSVLMILKLNYGFVQSTFKMLLLKSVGNMKQRERLKLSCFALKS
jgi:hypothetical protein